jgi:CHAT domain-containing protein
MKKISFSILFAFCSMISYAQSELSDELFAKGVELYKTGKYKDAIPVFEKVKKMDETELDSTNSRRNYASLWIASSYLHLGDSAKAKSISPYYLATPVDRRLTVKSDSISVLMEQFTKRKDYVKAIELCNEMMSFEKDVVGDNHFFIANDYSHLAFLYRELGDTEKWCKYLSLFGDIYRLTFGDVPMGYGEAQLSLMTSSLYHKKYDEALAHMRNLKSVFHNHETWTKENAQFIYLFCNIMLDYYHLNEDLILELAGFISPLYDIPYEQKGNDWYGRIIIGCAKAFDSIKQYGKAIELCRSAFSLFQTKGVRNESRFLIGDYYFTLAHDFYVSIPDEQPADVRTETEKIMLDIADDAMKTLEQTTGINNFEWATLAINKAAILFSSQRYHDYDKSKHLLNAGFDYLTMDSLLTDSAKVDMILTMLCDKQELFVELNNQEKFVKYCEKLLFHPFAKFETYAFAWFLLAENYIAANIDRKSEAMPIYCRLADYAIRIQDDEMYVAMLKRIFYLNYFSHQYAQAFKNLQMLNDYIDKHENLTNDTSARNKAERLYKMAECVFEMNDTLSTITYQQQAMQILRQCIDTNNNGDEKYTIIDKIADLEQLGEIANNSGHVNWVKDVKKDADIPYLEEALALIEENNGEVNEKLLQTAIHLHLKIALGHMGYQVNLVRQTKEHLQKALELCTDTLNRQYASILWQIGRYYDTMSIEPELALDYYLKSIEITREATKDWYPSSRSFAEIMSPWQECAELCFYLGNDLDGLSYQQRYLDVQEQNYGSIDNYTKIESIKKDIEVHSPTRVRDFRHWEYEENQLVDIERCRLLADSLETVYMNIPLYLPHEIYFDMNNVCRGFDKDLANEYYQKALTAIKKLSLEERYDNAYYFRYLLSEAESKGPQQVIITGKQLADQYRGKAKNISEYITSLFWMAKAYTQINKGQQAMDCYKEALALSMNHDYNNTRLPLGFIHTADSCKDYLQIASYYPFICNCIQKDVLHKFEGYREDEREKYWKQYERVFYVGENILELNNSQELLIRTYDNLLFRKSFLLNSSISAMNLIQTSGDSLLMVKYERMEWLKTQLLSNGKGDIIANDGRVLSREVAIKLVRRFENEIMRQAAILGNYTSALVTTWNDVRDALHADETAIEFTRYKKNGKYVYAAMVLQADGTISFVPLCTQDELDNTYTKDDLRYSSLYNIVWKPLLSFISNKKRVFFSPDGELHNLPLESVMMLNGCSLSEGFSLLRVSSTRELTKDRYQDKLKEAVLYGGIKYELENQERVENEHIPSYVFRDVPNIRELRGSVRMLPFLPGSKIEVDSINSVLQNEHISVILNVGANGTEESFKVLSGKSIPLVHISTHGFYEQEKKKDEVESDDKNEILSRMGLLMAGAADYLFGDGIAKEQEDGILTAKEISKLDFRGLGTVILSACETALGDITGEGVFGLQRGFKKAGANSILMSLWKVDDEATCLLMTEFYKNWIGEGKTKHDALEQAKLSVRSHKEKGWDDPKYWAAFILLDALD